MHGDLLLNLIFCIKIKSPSLLSRFNSLYIRFIIIL
nr:MAG TPA: hypothetical protein [Caudoviricetes sp.]DAP56395.1 MAG TPA: hypothetical protein [Caudoviricetes sp.]DAY60946.1 MAG TPA: hypothetical protein [Caudoviricetes sp.]